jgi:mRNA interferase MazF
LFDPGDVVVVDFPGVGGVKRRPAVVLSSETYHSVRPDMIVGLITSQTAGAIELTDYALLDWSVAGLKLPSASRAFLATIPRPGETARIGRLSDRDWLSVRQRLKAALAGLDDV